MKKFYGSLQRVYLRFCEQASLTPSERVLCYFAAKKKLKQYDYLFDVRFLHISRGRADPLQQSPNQLFVGLRDVSQRK